MPATEPTVWAETFDTLAALPAPVSSLFDAAAGFFSTRAWWETVLNHAMPRGAVARFVLIRDASGPLALFPMIRDGAAFGNLTTAYTCLYDPLVAAGADRAAVFAAFAGTCRGQSTTRLDALDMALEPVLVQAARAAGLFAARFDHFGNWHENIAGLDWPGYLARRPGALRETIRRRTRRAERVAGARFQMVRDTAEMEAGIAAFEIVYARSWKEPEPFPAVNPAQIRAAAGLGIARLAIWWIGDTPAAAQFWIVEPHQATVLKLAHDEAFKAHSPGTVLTAWTIRHMIEREHAPALDFGRGDDAYKRHWASARRRRCGFLLIDPRKPAGAFALARHALGRLRARFRGAAPPCDDRPNA